MTKPTIDISARNIASTLKTLRRIMRGKARPLLPEEWDSLEAMIDALDAMASTTWAERVLAAERAYESGEGGYTDGQPTENFGRYAHALRAAFPEYAPDNA